MTNSPGLTRSFRLAAAVAILATSTVVVSALSDPVSASTRLETGSGFGAPRQEFRGAGDMVIIGNSNHTCDGASPKCIDARNGIGRVNNNDWPMVWVDIDNDPDTINSSSAELEMPPGSAVQWAGLYWSGVRPVDERQNALPAPEKRSVKFKAPGKQTYESIEADEYRIRSAGVYAYQAFADVTSQVVAGGVGNYFVADIWSMLGNHTLSGWSMVVMFSNNNEPTRSLTVYDGFRNVHARGGVAKIDITGLKLPAVGPINSRVGFMAIEGDRNGSGDKMSLNGVELSVGSARPADNFFNSSITTPDGDFTARNPDFINTFSFDTGLVAVPDGALTNTDTTAEVKAQSNGDNYDVMMLAFATELFAPKFEQTISIDKSGGWNDQATWGDRLTVTLDTTLAADNSDPTKITVEIPDGLTLVCPATVPPPATSVCNDTPPSGTLATLEVTLGSRGIGPLPEVKFDVTVDGVDAINPGPNPPGTVRAIDYTIEGTGASSGVLVEQTSDRVLIPIGVTADLSTKLTWLDTEPTIPGAVATAGAPVSMAVDVRNNGPLAAPQSVEITLPTNATYQSVSGSGWACGSVSGRTLTCTRTALITANTAAPRLLVTLDVPAGAVDGSTLIATAATKPTTGSPDDPDSSNNSETKEATVRSKTDLGVTIAHSGSTVVGTDIVYTLVATNDGPSAAGATPNQPVVVTTTLPANVTFVSATGSGWTCSHSNRVVTCTRAALGVDQSAPPITLTARVNAAGNILTRTEISGGGLDRNADNDRAVDNTVGTLRAKLIESVNNGVALDINSATPTDAVIRVFNAGPSPLPAGAVVTHTMQFPQGSELVGVTAANGWVCEPSTGISRFTTECARTLTEPWPALSELPTMTMSVKAEKSRDPDDSNIPVAPDGPMVLRGTVSTDLETLVLDLGAATAQTDLRINDSSDLSITGTPEVELSATEPSAPVVYTVTNNGNSVDPGSTTVTLSSPDGASLTTAPSGPWSCSVSADVMTCTLNQSIAVGATAPPINATLTRAGSPTSPTDTLIALVYSESSDPDPTNNAASTEVISSGGFVPIAPVRPIDTRPSSGGDGPVEGGSVLTVDLSDALDPARALAAVINITAVDDLGTVPDDGRVGYITAYPCGQDRPNVSNVNYIAGDVSSNTAITRIGDAGTVCLFVSDTVNVLVDITGWFSDGYFGDEPHRLVETRGPGGVGRPIAAGTLTRVQVAGSHGIPADAVGTAINVTAVNPLDPGFITVWDCAAERPNTSNVNFAPISPFWAVANFSINELSDSGEICVYNSAATDLLVDVFGWFDDTFVPVANTRLLDTRNETALDADDVVRVQITGTAGVPADARSVAVNVTAVEAADPGFATVFTCEQPRPNVSKINFFTNETVANTTFIGLDDQGGLCIYTSGGADYLMDIFGWFTTDVIRS